MLAVVVELPRDLAADELAIGPDAVEVEVHVGCIPVVPLRLTVESRRELVLRVEERDAVACSRRAHELARLSA